MNLILIPGFWLGGWSWDGVVPTLEAAGHHAIAVTPPGLESVDVDRSSIGMEQTILALVELIDRTEGDIVLIGHSGGGAVAYGVTDRRPARINRVIYVDSGPAPDGSAVNTALPGDGVEIPLPPWETFSEGNDLRDLSDEMLDDFRARAIPEPWGVANDPLFLRDEARFDIPVTMISTTFTREQIDQGMREQMPYFAELARIHDVEIIEFPTGHWPQFSKPQELARHILSAL